MPQHKTPRNSRKITATAAGAVLAAAGVVSGGVALSREKPAPVADTVSLADRVQDKAARDLARHTLTPSSTPTATATTTPTKTATPTPAEPTLVKTRSAKPVVVKTRSAKPTRVKAWSAKRTSVKTRSAKRTGYGPTKLRANGRTCKASYYHYGQVTANGESFNPNGMTAAHKTMPFGSKVLVTNVSNGKSVIVRVNDRGPFVAGRCLDLARGAFAQIAPLSAGVVTVKYQVLK
ncbi:septal ring lytic transglycosylase RlpA family protein [Carbonactinospora thermoautotrophica]|uniref:septal ring lytic transglycosylase RlpA family protein n=1 Tax=Carbonactinospora thermoautotrophica TaxID=1469144 RepID=UPI000B069D3F|nr:septal ring lytic transglycosylase RlpA family protein [Carbonactinospora thermoautotrophica]